MEAKDSFTLTWCAEHKNWYQYNCPDCMFKTGEQQGIEKGRKEVVDFVITNKMIPLHDYKTTGTIRQDEEHREDCRRCKWQAFLKGIDKEE